MDWDSVCRVSPLLATLNPPARRELARGAVRRRFRTGEILWTAGSEPRGLVVVLEGQVRVVRAPAGRQYVVHTEGPGGTLGEVPLFSGGRYPATAQASQPTTCLVIGRELLGRMIAVDPGFAFALLAALAGRIRTLVARLDAGAGRPVRSRLAAYLLDRAPDGEAVPFSLGATHVQVAEELGTVREVLVRALRALRSDGLIASAGRGRYLILDRPALRRLAR